MAELEAINRRNISRIESFLDSIFREKLSDNIFFGGLPNDIEKVWQDVVTIDISNIVEKDGYGKGKAMVFLYAQCDTPGEKNVPVLHHLEETLNAIVLSSSDPFYHINIGRRFGDYDAINDMFYNVVELNLIIT